MKKALSYAWKIPLSLFFLFLILGVSYDVLDPYQGNSPTPVWSFHQRTEFEFYAHAAVALATSSAALVSIWAKFNYRYRLMLAMPYACYQIYLLLTVLPE